MPIRNPFRPDGEFTTVDKFAVLSEEVKRMRPALQRLVDQKRMRPENFAAKVGALDALVEDLRHVMSHHHPLELQGREPRVFYFANGEELQEFLTMAEMQGIPSRNP